MRVIGKMPFTHLFFARTCLSLIGDEEVSLRFMVAKVTVTKVVAPVFATNCCVLVSDDGDCVVVDPGAGVAADVIALIEKNAWNCVGVLATHGHADHTWDAAELCEHFEVAFHIHADDAYRLDDPIGTLATPGTMPTESVGVAIASMIRQHGLADYRKPANVETFTIPSTSATSGPAGPDLQSPSSSTGLAAPDSPRHAGRESQHLASGTLKLGSIEIGLVHAPGHTQGSTLYLFDGLVLTGDVLFAGSIGRTDLPGGDNATMIQTLRALANTLHPSLVVIPGHGPQTTMRQELVTNPYLSRIL
jgi:glyoxylase-like metal-dependent hydrolase (beta-lactamase superfamily II)